MTRIKSSLSRNFLTMKEVDALFFIDSQRINKAPFIKTVWANYSGFFSNYSYKTHKIEIRSEPPQILLQKLLSSIVLEPRSFTATPAA